MKLRTCLYPHTLLVQPLKFDEWIGNSTPHVTAHVIDYPLKVIHANKRGLWCNYLIDVEDGDAFTRVPPKHKATSAEKY